MSFVSLRGPLPALGRLVALATGALALAAPRPLCAQGAPPALGAPAPPRPAQAAGAVVAPKVVKAARALYPRQALGESGTVLVDVTVGRDGSAGAPRVARSLTPACDAEAVRAATAFVFSPATRDGVALAARIRLAFKFEPVPSQGGVAAQEADPAPPIPSPEPPPVAEQAPSQPSGAPVGGSIAAPTPAPGAEEIVVDAAANQRTEQRSASDFKVRRAILEAAPHHEGVDMLRTAPGMYIARPEGTAVAHRYMLRGFDSEHGQDIEFRVAGLPINQPSHIHGQGYADLGFLIGDTVDELRITEGVHDPSQGDFAVAGTIDIRLGVEERGLKLKSSLGSFGTYKQLLLWAPESQARDSFGALSYQQSNGFGPNRRGQSVSAVFQQGLNSGDFRTRIVGIFYAARADMAGVLRRDDIADGRVGFYDVYPYPTAEAQNALAGRAILGFFSDYAGLTGDRATFGAWLGYDNFRIQENFTGFLQRSQTLANVSGRGDLIEQQNRSLGLGGRASYRSAAYEPTSWAHGYVEVGLAGRVDNIDQAQNLLDATVRLQTWDQRIDANIVGTDVGAFADLDFHLTERFKLRFGVRGDALSYNTNDRLGNRAPAVRPDDAFIVGFRRSAMGLAFGPRTSADFHATDWLTLHASYGEGYRSPQARTLDDGEKTPFTKVRSADLGTRLTSRRWGELTLGGYWTALSDDVAFDATEGRLERVGETRRLGAVVHGQLRPTHWLVAASSVTYVDAELREPPPATASDPEPPFSKGQNLPFVPPLVVRADLGAHSPLPWQLPNGAVIGRLGLGFSMLSSRPLPFGDFSKPFALLDVSGGLNYRNLTLGLEVFNLLNSQYSAIEYSFVSDWNPDTTGSRLPARHISAGAPRTVLATVAVAL